MELPREQSPIASDATPMRGPRSLPRARGPGRFAGGGRFRFSLGTSTLIHVAIIAVALAWFGRQFLPVRYVPRSSPTVITSTFDEDAFELPEEVVEPPPEVESEPPEDEPELVETEVPFEWDPPIPEPLTEPLDWLPPQDLFTDVVEFRKPPPPVQVSVAAPPEPEPEPEPAPVPPPEPSPPLLEGDQIPTAVENPSPVYPRKAMRLRWEGTVRLRIAVDASGVVTEVLVVESSGHTILDEAAVRAFRRWIFSPRREQDPEVRQFLKPFRFQIG